MRAPPKGVPLDAQGWAGSARETSGRGVGRGASGRGGSAGGRGGSAGGRGALARGGSLRGSGRGGSGRGRLGSTRSRGGSADRVGGTDTVCRTGTSSSSSSASIAAIFSRLQNAVLSPFAAGATRAAPFAIGPASATGPPRSSSSRARGGGAAAGAGPRGAAVARAAQASSVSPGHCAATEASTFAASRGSGRSGGDHARIWQRNRRTSSSQRLPWTSRKSIASTRDTTSSSWASGSFGSWPSGSAERMEWSTIPSPYTSAGAWSGRPSGARVVRRCTP